MGDSALRRALRPTWTLLRAWAWLVWIRLGLALLPFERVCRLQARLSRPTVGRPPLPRSAVPRLADAVSRASHCVPGARCLAQALATQLLLGRAGHASEVRYGVAHKTPGNLDAHAWVECEGHVVIGEPQPGEFTILQ